MVGMSDKMIIINTLNRDNIFDGLLKNEPLMIDFFILHWALVILNLRFLMKFFHQSASLKMCFMVIIISQIVDIKPNRF